MSVLYDIEGKLEEAEARVADVTGKLESLADLQGTLDDSNIGLKSAAEKVDRVAISVENSVATLKDTLDAFRDVVNVLRRSDPARLFEAQTRVESGIEAVQQHITQVEQFLPGIRQKVAEVQDDIEKLHGAVGGLETQIQSLVEKIVGEAESRLKEEIGETESRLREEIGVVMKSVRIGQILSAAAVVGVVISVVLLLMK